MKRAAGFGYLGMLFFVAITAASLAALGQRWTTAAERERERELEFRGGEIARAIASYARVSPGGLAPQYPLTLEDLLEDKRSAKPRHHLRRAYTDPFTGLSDWSLVPATADGRRFAAVHSRSEHLLLRESNAAGMPLKLARDWVFAAADYEAPASAEPGASAPAQSPFSTSPLSPSPQP